MYSMLKRRINSDPLGSLSRASVTHMSTCINYLFLFSMQKHVEVEPSSEFKVSDIK